MSSFTGESNELWNAPENTASIEDTFVQNDITNTAQTLADLGVDLVQSNLQGVRVGIHDGDVRIRDDGGADIAPPTSTTGTLLKPGIYWFSKEEARFLKLVAVAGNVEASFQPQTFVG